MEEKKTGQWKQETERLYHLDSRQREFQARVLQCEKKGDRYQIRLDRTAFFPEGGGQEGDQGWLNGIRVLDTKEVQGTIWHETGEALPEGSTVEGKLDFALRFDRMQQHSGEHILSGIVHRLYGYDNVGFHLGEERTTLDFNGELTSEQAEEAELLANQAVFANVPVRVLYPSEAELQQLSYRNKIEIEGQVRIVMIEGYDVCACCAPHVASTGEIGLIKILSCERHRGGCRMEMVCGKRALMDYRKKQRSVEGVSVALSARPDEICQAVLRQKEQQGRLREQLNRMQAVYLGGKLKGILPETEGFCIFEEELDMIAARNFVNGAMERCGGVCGAFVGSEERGWHYILGSRTMDLRSFCAGLNRIFEGRGGGRPEMVQGSLKGSREEIQKYIEENASKS